jgi:hypothetical protein
VLCSYVAFLGVILLQYAPSHASGRFKAGVLQSFAMMVAFGFRRTYTICVDYVSKALGKKLIAEDPFGKNTGQDDGALIFEIMFTIPIALVVLPALYWYISPNLVFSFLSTSQAAPTAAPPAGPDNMRRLLSTQGSMAIRTSTGSVAMQNAAHAHLARSTTAGSVGSIPEAGATLQTPEQPNSSAVELSAPNPDRVTGSPPPDSGRSNDVAATTPDRFPRQETTGSLTRQVTGQTLGEDTLAYLAMTSGSHITPSSFAAGSLSALR